MAAKIRLVGAWQRLAVDLEHHLEGVARCTAPPPLGSSAALQRQHHAGPDVGAGGQPGPANGVGGARPVARSGSVRWWGRLAARLGRAARLARAACLGSPARSDRAARRAPAGTLAPAAIATLARAACHGRVAIATGLAHAVRLARAAPQAPAARLICAACLAPTTRLPLSAHCGGSDQARAVCLAVRAAGRPLVGLCRKMVQGWTSLARGGGLALAAGLARAGCRARITCRARTARHAAEDGRCTSGRAGRPASTRQSPHDGVRRAGCRALSTHGWTDSQLPPRQPLA
jgi:hypothetical protein